MSNDTVDAMCLACPSLSGKVTPDSLDVTEFFVTILVYSSISHTSERMSYAYWCLLGESRICMLLESIYIIKSRLL